MDDDEIVACVAAAVGRAAAAVEVERLGGKQGLMVCRVRLQGAPACVFKAVRRSGARELALTAHLSRVVPDAVPQVLAYEEDSARDLYWLVTRDQGARRLADAPTVEGYVAAAELLGKIQLTVFSEPEAFDRMAVPCVDGARWEETALRVLEAAQQSEAALVRRSLDDLAEVVWSMSDVVRDTSALPFALVHGDLHAGNVVVADGDPPKVCLLDWGSAYVATALMAIEELLWPAARHLRSAGDQLRVRAAYYRVMAPLVGKPGRLERPAAACSVLMRLQLVEECLLRPAGIGAEGNEYAAPAAIGRLFDAWTAWRRFV